MKFRKKPVVIDAVQFNGEPSPIRAEGICDCACLTSAMDADLGERVLHVHTLEGPIKVSLGDWIVTGVIGEKYPCKPDVFELTYEPA